MNNFSCSPYKSSEGGPLKDLTLTEELLLLAVLKLGDDAYGVTIRRQVAESTRREYPYGTLYSALDALVRRDLLSRTVSDPLPERGGRSRNYYRLTPAGHAALRDALALKQAMWDHETERRLEREDTC
jgi:DNA-binding PadR family transcriptional regulator